jgi:pantoate--beta-alanine ligase
MGALHAGHVSLVEASCDECDFTVVTIFVNPLQFAPHEDFQRYPRTLEADLQALAALPVDVVFAPTTAEEVFPPGQATFVEIHGVAEPLEGEKRPGHFRGVATVVLKLFNMSEPDVAFFGAKDYQQVAVVRQMVRDFNLPIDVRVQPTIRDIDGLALSSRNQYLTSDQRRQALALNRSLRTAADLVARGTRTVEAIRQAMQSVLATAPDLRLDYLAIVDPDTFAPATRVDRPTLVALAAFVGATRLIDNQVLVPPTDFDGRKA